MNQPTPTQEIIQSRALEKYSSAISLSDMEIFIFPQLLFPLVIANIMSPILWRWRQDPWFKDIEKKGIKKRVNRIRQYIMDQYVFNLDLETWGLTHKDRELGRFSEFIDLDTLRHSNALFGYEGDKYYFDIDIRRHFGLDKYHTDIIPYWKTETLEAMTAFRHKNSFRCGAGECVSFSALYAAALYVVGQIPLEKIFMIGTPLHSQNFIDIEEGILTNNRRLVTKNMWFNGTAMSTKARRALENEKITIVAHISGHIHYMYPEATISPEAYQHFSKQLQGFVSARPSAELFLNFLRFHMDFKKCFQYRHQQGGRHLYIGMETIFAYEHASTNNFGENSREALLSEIDDMEFSLTPLEDRLVVQDIEAYLNQNKSARNETLMKHFIKLAHNTCVRNEKSIRRFFEEFARFLVTQPKLPAADKAFISNTPLDIKPAMSREQIIELVRDQAKGNEMALLTLFAWRDMEYIDWAPFVKAALDRNPVCLEELKNQSIHQVYQTLQTLPNESIYEENRLAQPDEVWNFRRGDGIEKAFLLANFILEQNPESTLNLHIENQKVVLNTPQEVYIFQSQKQLTQNLTLQRIL